MESRDGAGALRVSHRCQPKYHHDREAQHVLDPRPDRPYLIEQV
jgi:hypothetical protein